MHADALMSVIHSTDYFARFRATLVAAVPPQVRDPRLLVDADGDVKIYYAPFEYINPTARVVLVGITPGPTQMGNANHEARRALLAGASDLEAMRRAKDVAAFSGEPMRSNLIKQIDHWGLPEWLGIADAAELFASAKHLVHSTSLLRYPVFVSDHAFRGKPDMTRHPLLRKYLLQHFVSEVQTLTNAVFLGLGPLVQNVLDGLVRQRVLPKDRVLGGMLHPSGRCTRKLPRTPDTLELELSGTLQPGGSDEKVTIHRNADRFDPQAG